ncbi:hypothetical protein ACFFON_05400 [Arthrobacter citreus]|uniref:hypothetical protein n=1 Tax=Arthrobacter TaxID=1663 RepID=UPI001264D0E3|nr:hypothetical protein [Arthrobacter gandavensis]
MAQTPSTPYVAGAPKRKFTNEELRARIPGWGADLDPADRPSVPKMQANPTTGAHWDFPERQQEKQPREHSIEHQFVTPVFGTSAPLRGMSGALRRYAYTFSEARAAHWLILIAADRVDAGGSHLRSFLTAHPDNPVTETGVLSEFTRHGLSSRLGKNRADLKEQALAPVFAAGPWILAGGAAFAVARRLVRAART